MRRVLLGNRAFYTATIRVGADSMGQKSTLCHTPQVRMFGINSEGVSQTRTRHLNTLRQECIIVRSNRDLLQCLYLAALQHAIDDADANAGRAPNLNNQQRDK